MNFYPEAFIVELTVPFTDLNDSPITPTALRAKLFDGEDTLLEDFGTIDISGVSGQKTITIASIYNELTDDEIRQARVVKIELDTPSGTIFKRHSYVVEAEQTLEIMTNTFQTFETAQITAANYVNLSAWTSSDETRQRAALSEAYGRICSIPMKYCPRDDLGQNTLSSEQHITRAGWLDVSKDAFSALPTHFRKALRAAQLLEANELLAGDSAGRRHRAGIVTETIGESSVTLRSGQINYGVSQNTLAALAGYVAFNVKLTRV
jgi:hypothetical protein